MGTEQECAIPCVLLDGAEPLPAAPRVLNCYKDPALLSPGPQVYGLVLGFVRVSA